MQLLALHLDGYIPLLLYGFLYFQRIGNFIGESLILRRLRKILLIEVRCKLIDDAEWSFQGVTLTKDNKDLNLFVEWGICTEEAKCNLWGEIVILNLFVVLILSSVDEIPSDKKRHSYRLF